MRRLAQAASDWPSCCALTSAALAVDNGQFDHVPPDIRAWFKSVIAPNGVPCCDVSDGHRTNYDVRGGAYWVPIEGAMDAGARRAPSSATAAIRSARPWCGTCTTAAAIIISCFVPADAV